MIKQIIAQMGISIPENIVRHLGDLYRIAVPNPADKEDCECVALANAIIKAYLIGRDEPLAIAVGLYGGIVNYGYLSRPGKVTLDVIDMDFDVDGQGTHHIKMSDGDEEEAWVYSVSCHEEPGFDFRQLVQATGGLTGGKA